MRKAISAVAVALVLVMAAPTIAAEISTSAELQKLLHEFLEAAGRGDKAVFDRFFADDLIYTRSAGVTITKAEIMKGLNEPPKPDDPKSTYSADDITVRDYGDIAVVNFRLMQHLKKGNNSETNYYRNTGTFLKRNGRWQAVAWQSTRVPANESGSK
jgi:hypothetical protein